MLQIRISAAISGGVMEISENMTQVPNLLKWILLLLLLLAYSQGEEHASEMHHNLILQQ